MRYIDTVYQRKATYYTACIGLEMEVSSRVGQARR
jgi:hypothetical protein